MNRLNSPQFNKVEDYKTAYAYQNNQLVHIENVARGLACNCFCVKCGGRLIAKKGYIKIHHFSHAANTNCHGAAETALHLLSKELFFNLSSMHLPQYKLKIEKRLKSGFTIKHEGMVVRGGEIDISKVFIERAADRFVPDITIESNSKTLFVEIAVSHKVDRNKLRRIRRQGTPTIEIQLDIADATLTREELSNKLKNDLDSKLWLFHPKQRKTEQEYFRKVRSAMQQSRKPAINPHEKFLDTTDPHYYKIKMGKLSNTDMDRLLYQFFLKFGRQPTVEEEKNLQANPLRYLGK